MRALILIVCISVAGCSLSKRQIDQVEVIVFRIMKNADGGTQPKVPDGSSEQAVQQRYAVDRQQSENELQVLKRQCTCEGLHCHENKPPTTQCDCADCQKMKERISELERNLNESEKKLRDNRNRLAEAEAAERAAVRLRDQVIQERDQLQTRIFQAYKVVKNLNRFNADRVQDELEKYLH